VSLKRTTIGINLPVAIEKVKGWNYDEWCGWDQIWWPWESI
jgi:hypothetical protein